ncbi:MAG: EF-hand domain-containing protein [Pseudomonadota bacterium]
MKRTLALLALAAGFGAFSASAQLEDAFSRIDANKDGGISQAEYVAHMKILRVSERKAREQFGQLSGQDGFISIEEFRAGPNRPVNVRPRQQATRNRPPARPPRTSARQGQRGFGS